MLPGTVVHNKNNTTKSQVTNGIFQFYHHLLHSDVIIYSKHIQEYSLSLDWLNIFYNVLLTLILQYPTMFEGLINSSKIALLNFRHYPHLTSGGDQLLFYLQCIVFVSDLFFYRDIGNNSCFSFQMTCCICLVSSFHTVIFLSHWSCDECRYCTALFEWEFPALSRTGSTTPSLPERNFSTVLSFLKNLFLSSLLMVTTSPILNCFSYP